MRARRRSALRHFALALALGLAGGLALAACGDDAPPAPRVEVLTPSSEASPSTTKKHQDSTTSPAPAASSAKPSAKPSVSSSSARPGDKTIKRNILARIAAEAGLRGFTFEVGVEGGVVTVVGRVRTNQQKRLAEQICLSEPGVKKVVSAIAVSGASGY